MFDPGPCVYMEKIAGGEDIADLLDLDRPLGETLALIAERKGCDIRDVMVVMLDRPRHEEASRRSARRARASASSSTATCRAALLAVTERTAVDLLWGIGGTPEGVISAAAIKCIGGQMVGRLWPRNDEERQAAHRRRLRPRRGAHRDDLVGGDDCFFSATGVTDGDVLQGVRYEGARRDDDRVAGNALALRHRPPGPGAARPGEAARDHRRAVRLGSLRRRRRRRAARAARWRGARSAAGRAARDVPDRGPRAAPRSAPPPTAPDQAPRASAGNRSSRARGSATAWPVDHAPPTSPAGDPSGRSWLPRPRRGGVARARVVGGHAGGCRSRR